MGRVICIGCGRARDINRAARRTNVHLAGRRPSDGRIIKRWEREAQRAESMRWQSFEREGDPPDAA